MFINRRFAWVFTLGSLAFALETRGFAQELSELAIPPNGVNQKAEVSQWAKRNARWDNTFVTYVGLARGYTAMGDTKKAIANWELALKNLPESQKPSLPVYEEALKALKEKGD